MREAFSYLEVTVGSFVKDNYTSCSWSDLCWSTTPIEGSHGLKFPPFIHTLSNYGLVEFKVFRDGFVTLSSLVSINQSLRDVTIATININSTNACEFSATCNLDTATFP